MTASLALANLAHKIMTLPALTNSMLELTKSVIDEIIVHDDGDDIDPITGPWTWKSTSYDRPQIVVLGSMENGRTDWIVSCDHNRVVSAEVQARITSLIVAAPELYAIAQQVLAAPVRSISDDLRFAAEQAIEKSRDCSASHYDLLVTTRSPRTTVSV